MIFFCGVFAIKKKKWFFFKIEFIMKSEITWLKYIGTPSFFIILLALLRVWFMLQEPIMNTLWTIMNDYERLWTIMNDYEHIMSEVKVKISWFFLNFDFDLNFNHCEMYINSKMLRELYARKRSTSFCTFENGQIQN